MDEVKARRRTEGNRLPDEIRMPLPLEGGFFDVVTFFGNCHATPLRRVTQVELELPLEKGGFSYINGREYPIRPDRLLCLRPGDERYTRPPFRCLYLKLSPPTGAAGEAFSLLPSVIPLRDPVRACALFRRILQHFSMEPADPFALSADLSLLLSLLSSDGEAARQKKKTPVDEVLLYMEEHLSEKLLLADLAAVSRYHPSYLHRLFCRHIGMTPGEYLLRRRLTKAKGLLCTTDRTPSEIAASVGFSRQSYFNYIFKKETGTTPTRFRKEAMGRYLEE